MSEEKDQPTREEIVKKLMIFRQIVARTEADEAERARAEEELWRTGPLARAVIENSPFGITVRSPDGKLLAFNQAWLRIWGLTPERARELDRQTEGWAVEDRYAYLGRWASRVRRAFEEGLEVFVPEASLEKYTPRAADWISLHFYPIRGEQGGMEQMVTITQDISDRKRAEIDLEAARARLEQLLEGTPVVLFASRPDGSASFISRNVKRELGYEPEDWLADPSFWRDRIHPEDLAAMRATGLPLAAARARAKEYRFLHADGIYRWLSEESGTVPPRPGGPEETAGCFSDVTARRWAEDTLRESEKRFRTLVENVRDIVFTCHAGAAVSMLNPAFESATGMARQEAIGKPLTALVFPDDAAAVSRGVAACLRGERPAPFDVRLPSRQGPAKTFELHLAPLEKEGAAGLLGVARDVSLRKQAEQELRLSEQYYRDLFENAHDPIIVFAPEDEMVLDVNRRACEVYGFEREEFLGMSLEAVSQDPARGRERIADTLDSGAQVNFETIQFRKDGRRLDIEVNASVVDYRGRRAILSINRDVTERKRADQALRASEQLNRAVIEHSPVGISVRSRTGRLLSYNRAWQEIWGMSEEDIRADLEAERTGLRFDRKDGYLGDWLPKVEEVYRSGGTLYIPELTISKPSFGGEKQIAQHFYALPAAEGGVDRVVVITQDVTERRQALQELTILARAVKSTSECISITDDRNVLLFVNDAFCLTYGYSRHELLGRHIGLLLPPSRPEADEAEVLEGTRAGGWRGELVNRRKDGTEFPIYLSTAVVRDEQGRPQALIGVARDITEQKRAEAQREKVRQALLQSSKLEALGNLAGGVAHDFNNLLTVIQGSAEMLQLKLGGESQLAADTERIARASARAAGLTRQLLQFSRRQPLDLAACNANPLAEKAAASIRVKAPAGVAVDIDLAPDLWPARAQAPGLTQVLETLLANALEAAGGRGRVRVSTSNAALDEKTAGEMAEGRTGRFVRLAVSDTGPGLAPETVKRLFEPFFSTKGPGRGLGLSAAYGIVKQFGGWIAHAPGPGGGAEFSVYLPEHSAGTPEPEKPPIEARELPGRGQLVLMVEDEPGIMKVFSAILRMKGYRVAEASGVVQAGALFRQQADDISLVFSDILLPDGNGMDLVQELAARKPGLKVVMTSGFTGDDERLQRIKELGYPFLPKPYNLHQLLETLAAALG